MIGRVVVVGALLMLSAGAWAGTGPANNSALSNPSVKPDKTDLGKPMVKQTRADSILDEESIWGDSADTKDSVAKAVDSSARPALVGPAPKPMAETPKPSVGAIKPPAESPIRPAGPESGPVRFADPSRSVGVTLGLLPLAVRGAGVDSAERAAVEAAVRLGASESGRYWVWSAEEMERRAHGGGRHGRDCFTERCLEASARGLGNGNALAAQYGHEDSAMVLKLVLLEAATGKIRAALVARRRFDRDSLTPFAREAAACLIEGREAPGLAFASGRWRNIPWLNPSEPIDNRRGFGWAGSGLLVAATGLAWAEGQLQQRDDNWNHPGAPLLDGEGPRSFLRGFFAAPDLGARYAAMGGSGIAQVDNGLALMMNPAGVAGSDRESAVAAKGSLPDGTPSLFIGSAGPLYGKWSQGLGVGYQGDALASETTVEGALAYDLAALGKAWEGIQAGTELKLYLADVGRSGTGTERATGHSFGAGLDIGLRARLNEKITAALAVRDALSILRHTNTLTNTGYAEVLPPEYRVGAAYRASPSLLLLMDGQKGLYADQADHLRLGAEKVAFGFLALRCGMHQIFGREAVRKLSVGFGIDSDGLGDIAQGSRVALNYGYEFGINQDEPLAGGQQFSLEMGF